MLTIEYEALNLAISDIKVASAIQKSAQRVALFFDSRDIARDDLIPVPPRRVYPRDYPLEWTQQERNAYFRKVRQGLTTFPYRRTGEITRQLRLRARRIKDGAIIEIDNSVPYAQDVIGDFNNKSLQKLYHRNTGWMPIADRLPMFADRVEVSMQEEIQINLDDTIVVNK